MLFATSSAEITLVCCHYLGGSGREWSALASHLDPSFELMPLDLPGFGSAHGLTGYSVEQMCSYVIERIRTRRCNTWVLVGHSMGGKVASVVARQAEDGVVGLEGLLSLILLAGSPPGPEPMQDSKRADMQAMFSGDEGTRRRDAEQYVGANSGASLEPQLRALAVQDAMGCNRAAWLAWLDAGSKEDWSETVGVLGTPTLIVTGEKDEGLGRDAQQRLTVPHVSNHQLVELTGAGHLLPLERPQQVAELITRQVRAVQRASATGIVALERYAEILRSPRVGHATRAALAGRLVADPGGGLNPHQLKTLRALTDCIVPVRNRSFDLAERIAQMLSEGPGDGWRPALLPTDRAACQAGLATLDWQAMSMHAMPFAGLPVHQQNQLLSQLAAPPERVEVKADHRDEENVGDGSEEELLTATQMSAWFEDVRADTVRLYFAHPETLARIGYSGIANGGDGHPKTGFAEVGLGRREAWEPVGQVAGISVGEMKIDALGFHGS